MCHIKLSCTLSDERINTAPPGSHLSTGEGFGEVGGRDGPPLDFLSLFGFIQTDYLTPISNSFGQKIR